MKGQPKLPRRMQPKSSYQHLQAALNDINKRFVPLLAHVMANPSPRAAKRCDDLWQTSKAVLNSIHTKSYRQGFKALAKLRAKERKREWWKANRSPKAKKK